MDIKIAGERLCPMRFGGPGRIGLCETTRCMWWVTIGWKDAGGYMCTNDGAGGTNIPAYGHCSKGFS